jgi:hypothetical protein
MSEAGAAVSRFDFTNGALRGTHLTLYASCLVHRGDFHLETLPLSAVAAVRVQLLRDERRIGWGVALLVLALILYAVSAPLASFAAAAAEEMASAGTQGVARTLHSAFRGLGVFGAMLPAGAALCALGGIAVGALGFLGATVLTITLPGDERSFPVRGRSTMLLDFSEVICEQMIAQRKPPA